MVRKIFDNIVQCYPARSVEYFIPDLYEQFVLPTLAVCPKIVIFQIDQKDVFLAQLSSACLKLTLCKSIIY